MMEEQQIGERPSGLGSRPSTHGSSLPPSTMKPGGPRGTAGWPRAGWGRPSLHHSGGLRPVPPTVWAVIVSRQCEPGDLGGLRGRPSRRLTQPFFVSKGKHRPGPGS